MVCSQVKIDDVRELAEQQMAGASTSREILAIGLKPDMFDYGKYHTYEEVKYPISFVMRITTCTIDPHVHVLRISVLIKNNIRFSGDWVTF